MSTLPPHMPDVAGYDVASYFRPADLSGGDPSDRACVGSDLLVLLADAAGHGIAPARDVTRMHAMLRMGLAVGSSLDVAVAHVNNEPERSVPAGRFVTAFIGL